MQLKWEAKLLTVIALNTKHKVYNNGTGEKIWIELTDEGWREVYMLYIFAIDCNNMKMTPDILFTRSIMG